MKSLFILLLLPSIGFSQLYLNAEAAILTKEGFIVGAPAISAGGIIKNKAGKDLFTLGGGVGILFDEGDPFGLPVFAELGYVNRRKKFFPQVTARVGTIIVDTDYAEFFTSLRLGLACQVGATRIIPFAGILLVGDRLVATPAFGISVLFIKKKQ